MCKQPVLAFYCSRPLIYEGLHIGFQFHEGNSEFNSEERNSDSNSNYGNSNSIPIPPGLGKANSNSGIGLGISKKIQFRSGIDPDSDLYKTAQNTPAGHVNARCCRFITKGYTNWKDATRNMAGFFAKWKIPVSPGSCRENHHPSRHDQECRRAHIIIARR